jgi:murein DD-endopeptidase MepM/ murein hydrolase activator NlpD
MLPRQRTRAAALLVAGTAAVSAASLAAAEPTDPAERLDAPPFFPLPRVAAVERPRPAAFPVKGAVGYGESGARFGADRGGRMHEGQDVFAAAGTPLVAMYDGDVLETGNDGGRGNYVAVYARAERRTYVYLHMQRPSSVSPGERVRAGRRVGAVGCTGSCFGEHLHLEVRAGRSLEGRPLDPMPLLKRLSR